MDKVHQGQGGITAQVVARSNCDGTELTTMALKYPRFIHAEFMTHRMFSRNASSSRAIPTKKVLSRCNAEPVHWGKNQAGMQAWAELSPADLPVAEEIWWRARDVAVHHSEQLLSLEVHKQVVNRLTEPYQFIHVVVTATEWDNFFTLRLHEDAQPEIHELAKTMKEAMEYSPPVDLEHDEWHLPFILNEEMRKYTIEELLKMSVARCARVSYLNHDDSEPVPENDIALHDRLLEAGHMSPFEHQARPMVMNPVEIVEQDGQKGFWMDKGVTHFDSKGEAWSGNLKNWIQYRQTL